MLWRDPICARWWNRSHSSRVWLRAIVHSEWIDQHVFFHSYMWSWCHIAICLLGFLSISSQWFLSVPVACRPRLHLPSKRFCPSPSWLSISSSTLEAQSRSCGTSNIIISFQTGLILCFARFVCFFFSFRAWCFSVTLTDMSAGAENKCHLLKDGLQISVLSDISSWPPRILTIIAILSIHIIRTYIVGQLVNIDIHKNG